MSKRFIDTGLFDDSWFMDLTKEGKLLWIYMITKCNHAGIIELNAKLTELQTGISSLQTVIEELANRLITVRQGLYFIPKFIDFQYPNFPKSSVKQQQSAISILEKYHLFSNGKLTVSEHLANCYENENENENETVNENEGNLPSVEKSKIPEWAVGFKNYNPRAKYNEKLQNKRFAVLWDKWMSHVSAIDGYKTWEQQKQQMDKFYMLSQGNIEMFESYVDFAILKGWKMVSSRIDELHNDTAYSFDDVVSAKRKGWSCYK